MGRKRWVAAATGIALTLGSIGVVNAVGADSTGRAAKVTPPKNPYRVIIDDRKAGERSAYMSYTPTTVQLAGSDTIWLAGTTALPLYHAHPHKPEDVAKLPADAYSQAKLALEGVRRQLASAGATWTDVVRLNFYIADIDRNRAGVGRAAGEILGPWFTHPQGMGSPGGTMLGVDQLIDKENIVEIEGVAVVPKARRVAAVRRAAAKLR
jgi:2-iminobutanoate/2-iminopropanoate deaminase